jgi:hypothetical protein
VENHHPSTHVSGSLKVLKRFSFWLPALYLAALLLAGLDMVVGFSGSGEANAGAWILIFSVMPALSLANALGAGVYVGESMSLVLTFVLAQALVLLGVGAIIDALARRQGNDKEHDAQR